MNEPYFNILVAILGGALGFGLKWFLAERQERYELRRSIAQMRAEAYKSLWVLCKEKGLTSDELPARIEALWNWYNNGGGLFLSLAASKRFFAAVNSIQKENLSEEEKLKVMLDNLTWLRTEMSTTSVPIRGVKRVLKSLTPFRRLTNRLTTRKPPALSPGVLNVPAARPIASSVHRP